MNVQANGHEGSRQQIRQKILCDINSVWRFVETLEKQCREMLGETDPMAESLGFAATHMMNASCEIEEHVAECANQLTPESLTKLLEVLSIIRWSGPKCHRETREAYHAALKNVQSKYKLEINTVADLCVRRLGLVGDGSTDQFLSLVEGWLFKEGDGLCKVIKEHTRGHQYQKIDEFFKNGRIVQ